MTKTIAITEGRTSRAVRRRTRPLNVGNLDIAVAHTREEVATAWQLVYRSYRDADLIKDNPFQIHTVPHALRTSTTVVLGRLDKELVSTLTMMHDSKKGGLPLDCVYKTRLDELRSEGRKLMEVGLFADRRLHIGRATAAFMEMMRFVFYNSCYHLADIVIGVHPSHASFYQRNFGFAIDGHVDVHPTVNHRPVVLLRGDTQAQLTANPVPMQLKEYLNRPVPRAAFANQTPLNREDVAGSVLANFCECAEDLEQVIPAAKGVKSARIA